MSKVVVAGFRKKMAALLNRDIATITGGTLQLGTGSVLPDLGAVAVNGGNLDLKGFNETVGGFSLLSGSLLGGAVTLTSTTDFDLRQGSINVAMGGNVGVIVSGFG